MCWSWNTADKTCMHCTLFRPVFIESEAATELRSKCIKVDVNTFAAAQFNNRTLWVPYHYCYDLPYMCIWFEWVCFCFFAFIFTKTVFVLYLRSMQVISVITYCAQFLAYPHVSGAILIEFVCIKSINSIFTVYLFCFCFISPFVPSVVEEKSHEPNE